MSNPLIIYGAGGFGREVKSMLPYCSLPFDLVGFLDDGVKAGSSVDEVQVLGGISWLESNTNEVDMVIAMGNPKIKARIAKDLQKFQHVHFPVLIHERSHVQDMEGTRIGQGSIICAGVVLTTSIHIGDHVLINLNATVGHDTTVGNFTSIMPGVNLAGNVTLGNEVMVGSGANIINKIKVGNFTTIGAGSVVNHDIPAASTAAGVPARVIR